MSAPGYIKRIRQRRLGRVCFGTVFLLGLFLAIARGML